MNWLPDQFEIETSQGLGSTIVRTFVETELDGVLTLKPAGEGSGTVAEVQIPSNPYSAPETQSQV